MKLHTGTRTSGWKRAAQAAGIVAGSAAGWAIYSAIAANHRRPLPLALLSERYEFPHPLAGRLSYYADASVNGRPLVLIHSVNAAASAYEMKPLFEYYRRRRPVYALELPGFGFSERGDRAYTPRTYTAAITGLLRQQIKSPMAADLVALSLGSEFAALAAAEAPDPVRSLTLISPTGFDFRERGPNEALHRRLSCPLWSQPLFDLLVSPPSIRYYLQKSFEGAIPPDLAAYDHSTSHQPGARFAPLRFISGGLFTPNVLDRAYDRVRQPTLVLYDRDAYTGFERLPGFVDRHRNWSRRRIPGTRGMPHFERPAETTRALDHFWTGLIEQEEGEPRKVAS